MYYVFQQLITASVAEVPLLITRAIIFCIISLMFKGSCFSSEGYVACSEMEQTWVIKDVTRSNIQAWPI